MRGAEFAVSFAGIRLSNPGINGRIVTLKRIFQSAFFTPKYHGRTFILLTLKNVSRCILQPIVTDCQNLEGHTTGV